MSRNTLGKFKEYAEKTNSGWIEAAIDESIPWEGDETWLSWA